MLAPIDSPVMAEFVANLDSINASQKVRRVYMAA